MKDEIGSVVAKPDLVSTHPELHHYTTFAGLKGIIQSNTLWATHFRDLNDSTECFALRAPLVEALEKQFGELLGTQPRHIRRAMKSFGGVHAVAVHEASLLVRVLYDTTFPSNGSSLPFAEPFIASFCSHAADQPYERDNGLLSQWRGYGKDGGFCIVFDTAALGTLLRREADAYHYLHTNMDTVQYAVSDSSVATLFPELPEVCGSFLEWHLSKGGSGAPPETLFPPFIVGATLFKHQGFREERELRIVAVSCAEDVYARLSREHPQVRFAPLKPLLQEQPRRIALFDGLGAKLPIKRVIVGPSRNQQENFDKAHGVLGPDVPLHCSETPYVEVHGTS